MDEQNQDEPQTVSIEEFNKLKADLDAVLRKKDELLSETKDERKKRQDLERLQQEHEEKSLREKEDFKSLYERTEKERNEWKEKYSTFEQQIQTKDLEAASFKLAAQLAKDTARAELLAKEARQFAQYTDEGVKFNIGGMETTEEKVLEHLTSKYPFLVDANGSSGGGATGAKSGRATTGKNPFKRGEHFNLTEQAKIMQSDPDLATRLKNEA